MTDAIPNPQPRLVERLAELLLEMDVDWRAAAESATQFITTQLGVDRDNVGFLSTGDEWWSIAQLSHSRVSSTALAPVWVVNSSARSTSGSWDEVFSDPDFLVTPDSRFVGTLWDGCFDDNVPPLHLDADAWAGTISPYGEASGWTVWVDGEERQIAVEGHTLWGDGPTDEPEIEWLSVTGDPTGIVLRTDRFGCLWGWFAERLEMFFGRPSDVSDDLLTYLDEMLCTPYGDCEFSVTQVDCPTLEPAQMADLVRSVGSRDPNFDPDETEVVCLGFSGTLAELDELIASGNKVGDA